MKARIALFIVFGALSLHAYELDQLEAIFNTNRITEIPQIALNLSAKGSIMQSKGLYKEALELYEQSLHLREKLGLNKTQGYATVLFLSSIAEHKTGDSCKALNRIGQVIEIYNYLGKKEEARTAEEEGMKIYQKSCNSKLVSQN